MRNDLLDWLEDLLPEEWSHDADQFGWSFALTCPHGHRIEQDATCPEGCWSPLLEQGLI